MSLIVMQMDFDVLLVTEPGEDHRSRKGGGKPHVPRQPLVCIVLNLKIPGFSPRFLSRPAVIMACSTRAHVQLKILTTHMVLKKKRKEYSILRPN